jgi:hypothetical protein
VVAPDPLIFYKSAIGAAFVDQKEPVFLLLDDGVVARNPGGIQHDIIAGAAADLGFSLEREHPFEMGISGNNDAGHGDLYFVEPAD